MLDSIEVVNSVIAAYIVIGSRSEERPNKPINFECEFLTLQGKGSSLPDEALASIHEEFFPRGIIVESETNVYRMPLLRFTYTPIQNFAEAEDFAKEFALYLSELFERVPVFLMANMRLNEIRANR